jgi:sugar lactone lactonase YvrE
MADAEQVTEPVAFHAEGPVWSPSWGGLRWVDMFAGDVLSMSLDDSGVDESSISAIGRRHVGAIAAALRPRRGGGAVIAVERGFVLEDAAGELHALPDLWADPSLRMNEGSCDPDGRFYCGSMARDKGVGRGSMYRLDADGTTSVVFGGSTISNGLAWSPDGSTAYYTDTATGRVDMFDYAKDTGLTGRRTFVEIPDTAGSPDGMTVDAQGHVWVALYGGSAVRRYRPEGILDGVIELPVTNVTACAFAGAGLDSLVITTSREGVRDGTQPEAGSLFRSRPGVTGLPTAEFAG